MILIFVVWNCLISIFGVWSSTREVCNKTGLFFYHESFPSKKFLIIYKKLRFWYLNQFVNVNVYLHGLYHQMQLHSGFSTLLISLDETQMKHKIKTQMYPSNCNYQNEILNQFHQKKSCKTVKQVFWHGEIISVKCSNHLCVYYFWF